MIILFSVSEIEYENRIPRYGTTRVTIYAGWDGTETSLMCTDEVAG